MNPETIEAIFFDVLDDIHDYLPDLTLVGGWMPFVYANFLWKKNIITPVTTVDIDFGVDQISSQNYKKTLFETLSTLNYKEHHPRMGRMYPVVLYKEKVPLEFITYPSVNLDVVRGILGLHLHVNKIDKFEFLLKQRDSIIVQPKNRGKTYRIHYPKPSAFLYHKGATFVDRENKEKQAKDLYYMYFILRHAPDIDRLLEEIACYKSQGHLKNVPENMDVFFDRISSTGCLMVEKENGLDEYIVDIRQDVFDRFKKLREALQ